MPRSRIPGSYGDSTFNFLRNCHTVFHSSYIILHQPYLRVPISLLPCQHLLCFLDYSQPRAYEQCLNFILICISIMTNDTEHHFMCHQPFVYLLCRNFYSSPLPFFKLGCLFILSCILCILNARCSSVIVWFANIFSHSLSRLFIFLMVLWCTKFFNFNDEFVYFVFDCFWCYI